MNVQVKGYGNTYCYKHDSIRLIIINLREIWCDVMEQRSHTSNVYLKEYLMQRK